MISSLFPLHFTPAALRFLLPLALWASALNLAAASDKVDATPRFWQEDKEAGFVDGGSNYCGPTAISNGIIYLARNRGLTGLAAGATHADQISLIKELASEMSTDPKAGTRPDRIVSGLRHYVESKGFHIKRLEIATWRKLDAVNRAGLVGAKPNLEWMRHAASDPDCVEVFNVGWYGHEGAVYSRHSGHWVTVVGASAEASDFAVHNPLLSSEAQQVKTAVTLTMLADDFKVVNPWGGEPANLKGYFRVGGPGLPYVGKAAAAVLDSVIVFSVKK